MTIIDAKQLDGVWFEPFANLFEEWDAANTRVGAAARLRRTVAP